MLHILLLILKIIGIILAALLGIIALVLLCVLFVPVRYRIEAEGKLGGEQPVRAGVKVSWLLHIINVMFAYPEAACLRVRVLCFTVFDSSRKKKTEGNEKGKKEKRKGKRKGKQKQPAIEAEEISEEPAEKTAEKIIAESNAEIKTEVKAEIEERSVDGSKPAETDTGHNYAAENGEGGGRIEKTAGIGEKTEEKEQKKEQEEESSSEKGPRVLFRKIKAFCLAVKRCMEQFIAALKNIEYTIRKICDKIKGIIGNIQYYTEVLKSETFRGAWAVSRKQLLRALRMLRPQICRINVSAGTGDPAGTGQLLAFYGMLYPFIGNCVFVEADFENKVMEGNLLIKGRIRIVVLLLAAFQLFINKNIRRLLKLLKNPVVEL